MDTWKSDTSDDIVTVCLNFNMAAAKPEVLVTQKSTEIHVKFQRLEPGLRGRPTHLSYCQPYSMLADVGYRSE